LPSQHSPHLQHGQQHQSRSVYFAERLEGNRYVGPTESFSKQNQIVLKIVKNIAES